MTVLDLMPQLVARVTATEEDILSMQQCQNTILAEQKALRALVENHLRPDPANASSIGQAATPASPSDQLRLTTAPDPRQERQLGKIILGGLAYSSLTSDTTVDLRLLAFAALKAFHQDIKHEDISTVKVLESRPRRVLQTTSASQATSQQPLTSTSASAADNAPKAPPRLLVNLTSPSITAKVIEAKIRAKTVMTDIIDNNLLIAAGCAHLPSSTLNVNEYLPPQIYYISKLTRMKAREKNFFSFVRNGRVYARKKTDHRSTPINDATDLCNFLALMSLTSV